MWFWNRLATNWAVSQNIGLNNVTLFAKLSFYIRRWVAQYLIIFHNFHPLTTNFSELFIHCEIFIIPVQYILQKSGSQTSAKIQHHNERTFTNTHFSFSGGSGVDFISPVQTEVYRKSGDKVTLSCNYSSALSLYWYRQYPRSSPRCLLLILQNSGESQIVQPGMSVKLNEKKTSVDLEISSAKVSDSAVYYCALKPTVRGNPTALYKNLNLAWQSGFKYWKIY